jgi:hypothetical protein
MIKSENLAGWRVLTMRITSEAPCEDGALDVC